MSKAFGTKFEMINPSRQPLLPHLFGPRWEHLATFSRGLKQYICMLDGATGQSYIESLQVTASDANHLFEKIEDENEWNDCYMWLIEQKILKLKIGEEFFIAN